jgi:hypothetical protein
MNSYELSRYFVDWAFENPEKVKPIHYAIYFFAIEHCNRLGWKNKFGLPSQMVMEAIGVKNWRTYSVGLNDLVDFGFIEMLETSKNQYSANIIAIVKNTKAPTKALDKALSKHLQKHSTKQGQSTVSIDKQLNNKQSNNRTIEQLREFDFSAFDNNSIIQSWYDWITYKKEQFKDEYKSGQSHQIAINKLAKLSRNSSANAKAIIETSISNLYKGLFELKQQQNGTTNNKPNMDDRLKQAVERLNSSGIEPMQGFGSQPEPFSNCEII